MENPKAIVKKPRLIKYGGADPGKRIGRGFSKGELEAVGLTFKEALRLGIPIDRRRRTTHEWNIEILKEYLEKVKFKK